MIEDYSRNINGAFNDTITSTTQHNNTGADITDTNGVRSSSDFSLQGSMIADSQSDFINNNSEIDYSVLSTSDPANIFVNTAGSVAQKYFQAKLDRLKSLWNTKVDMSVGGLIGEVAPYTVNPAEAFSLLADKIDDLIKYLAGVDDHGGNTLSALVDDLGTDMLQYLANDPAMQEATMNLETVKLFGKALEVYSEVEKTVSKVLDVTGPLIPPLQIFTNIVLSYFSGGASASEAAQELTVLVEHYCQQLVAWAAGTLKKYLYKINIKLPSLVVGAINSISVREAMLTTDFKAEWLQNMFNNSFYEQTMYTVQWQDAINEAITTTLGSYADKARNIMTLNFTNSKGEEISRGEFMKSRFMSTLTSSFMKTARAAARKTAFLDHDVKSPNGSESSTGRSAEEEHDTDTNDVDNDNMSDLDTTLASVAASALNLDSVDSIQNISKQLSENF